MSDPDPIVYGGRYELHRRLARGGMADVYLARDRLLDRPVAVKVLFAQYAADPSFVERFRREAQAAANLNHPNIVGVFDWGEEEATYYIVMEYVNGRSLADVLRQEGTLLPERAADIGIDIAAALGFAHRNGVVHRDVKPGNVLLAADGQVKVTDFGIARAIAAAQDENLTQTGLVMGTATYFSPEQAQGRQVDPRSDVYSLGIVLYEAVCGRPPFRGDDALGVAYQHVQEPPTPPTDINASIDPTLAAIILKCLAKDAGSRYPSAEDLRSDLRRYREGQAIAAPPPPSAPTVAATEAVPVAAATTAQPVYDDVYDDPYEYGDQEPPKRNGAFIAILIALLLVLGVLLFFLARAAGLIGGDDDGALVEVPSVIGDELEEARAELEDRGFRVRTEFEDDPDIEDNHVIDQDPGPGEEHEEGGVVTLTVSSGEVTVEVPEVEGLREEDARAQLGDAGFNNIDVQLVTDRDVEEGFVVSQDPGPGVEAPLSAEVILEVSEGPGQRSVPEDLAGRPAEDVDNILRQLDLEVVQQQEHSDDIPEGFVIRTEPGPGVLVEEGDTVTVVVSAGVEQISVPAVTEVTRETAVDRLETAGFDVDVEFEDLEHGDPDDDRVLAQDPEAGERVDRGSTVTITVGRAAAETTTTTDPDDDNGFGL